jgi:hypothetical protein
VPKSVVLAHTFFLKENRKRIRENNRDLDSEGVKRKCQEEWMALSHAGRKKYMDLNAEDKMRHTKEMIAYLDNKVKNEDDEGA